VTATNQPKFPLGQTVMTRGVSYEFDMEFVVDCIKRHQCGDWGDVPPGDAKQNDRAIGRGMRIISAYKDAMKRELWIITEADRSTTTALKPSEY